MGCSDTEVEGTFRWEYSGDLVDSGYHNWYPGRPDDYQGHQDCCILWAGDGLLWDDMDCNVPEGFICESGPQIV